MRRPEPNTSREGGVPPTLPSMEGARADGRADRWAVPTRVGLAVGMFLTAVSFSLFVHTISQLSSPIVCAAFIAAGIVGLRREATTPAGRALAIGSIVGGAVAFVASIVLAATGR